MITPGSHSVFGQLLEIQLVHNSGASFSLLSGLGPVIGSLSIAAVIAIVRFTRSITSWKWGIALGALLGGILGNLSDRLFRPPYWFRGSVVDWIKLPHYPVFNLAYSSIVLSAVAIALLLVKNVKPRSNDER